MNILALDTATENCSVALYTHDMVYGRSETVMHRHAELLLKMVDETLQEAQLDRSQIDLIAFNCGPGSFTGVRIATAAAQGLALGLDCKVVQVTSLEAMAYEASIGLSDGLIVSAIDARMGEVYLGFYKKEQGVLKEAAECKVLKPKEAVDAITKIFPTGTYLACGTGIEILKGAGLDLKPEQLVLYPHAAAVVRVAAMKAHAGETLDCAQAQPYYLRNEVAWKKLSEQKKA